MATKRKRGKSWEYHVKRKALLPKPITLTFQDESEGDDYVARLEAMLDKGIVPEEFQKTAHELRTIADAIRSYQESVHVPTTDVQYLKVVESRKGESRLIEFSYAWVEGWVKEMKHMTLAPSTIRHQIGALARCMDWMATKHPMKVPVNFLRLLPKRYATYNDRDRNESGSDRKDEERDRRLAPGEEKEIRAILAGKKQDGKERPLELKHREFLILLFDLALETAMRLREMYTLTWDQVDIEKRTIFLERTKNGHKRQVPLSSVALALMKEAKTAKQNEWQVFPWWDGKLTDESLRRTTAKLSPQFARIYDAAGCGEFRFHDVRHEATSRLFERTTLSDAKIAKITGHSSPKMLMRYANLRGSVLADELW